MILNDRLFCSFMEISSARGQRLGIWHIVYVHIMAYYIPFLKCVCNSVTLQNMLKNSSFFFVLFSTFNNTQCSIVSQNKILVQDSVLKNILPIPLNANCRKRELYFLFLFRLTIVFFQPFFGLKHQMRTKSSFSFFFLLFQASGVFLTVLFALCCNILAKQQELFCAICLSLSFNRENFSFLHSYAYGCRRAQQKVTKNFFFFF